MKINDILVESKQLDEGPITRTLGKIGGKIAKGVTNIGKDLKTGFQAGYSGTDSKADPSAANPAAPTKKQSSPVAAGVWQGIQKASGVDPDSSKTSATLKSKSTVDPTTQQINKAGPTSNVPVDAPSAAVQTTYAQVKANIQKLDKKGKQRIMQLLQKSLGTPTAAQPAVTPKPTQAEIDADRERIMGSNSGESVTRSGKVMAESFSLFRK